MYLLADLLRFLSNLPSVQDERDRMALIMLTGCNDLRQDLDLGGSPMAFFTGLLAVLSSRGRAALEDFLRNLAALEYWIGPDRLAQVAELIQEVETLTDDDWRLLSASGGQAQRLARLVLPRPEVKEFAGREWLILQLDSFLDHEACGYFVVEGEAGVGKTTFLAWLVQERGYLHHFADQTPDQATVGEQRRSLGQAAVEEQRRSLAAQLAIGYGLEPGLVLEEVAARSDYVSRRLTEAADKREPGQQIVLVIDALDQVGLPSGQEALGLPHSLPKGVFVIVSQRPGAAGPWAGTGRTKRHSVLLSAEGAENQDDMYRYLEAQVASPEMQQVLQHMGIQPDEFIAALSRKSQGLWLYLHYVLPEIRTGGLALGDLDSLPEGMTQYYAQYWQGECARDEHRWFGTWLPLLATLAVVGQAVSVDDLIRWSGVTALAAQVERWLSTRWRAFITVRDLRGRPRYGFFHDSLRDFFTGRVMWERLTAGEAAFVRQLQQATEAARLRIVKLERDVMMTAPRPAERRFAASLLTRLRWLDGGQPASASELSTCFELLIKYLDWPPERKLLERDLCAALDVLPESPPGRRTAQLLIYRAINRAYLYDIGQQSRAEVAADYEQAEPLIAGLIGSPTSEPEDLRLQARLCLGTANPAPEDGKVAEAGRLYAEAAKAAMEFGQDPALEVTVNTQWSDHYLSLKKFRKAEQCAETATEAAERLRGADAEAYSYSKAQALDWVGYVQWARGNDEALDRYVRAYEHTLREIELLEGADEGFRTYLVLSLVIAHINAGDYLKDMSRFSGCPVQEPLERARDHWLKALPLARRLPVADLEKEVQRRLPRTKARSRG
jgi:Effector-associated domain 8